MKKRILLGDYNMDISASKRFVSKLLTGFQLAKVTNSRGYRWNKSKLGRMIDHIYYARLKERVNWCKKNTKIDSSDHIPMLA
ncbi:hypothetical protein AYI70_g4666 [Smittium culicis]|uniref:Endonuclease/exonuclease/phosphatase domain-containing protein n=1 Tax=Smittium culicis TaxID=133412 RepID=A0A1R1XY60_9FUNG|nr:hypothetical protein AYI70_g4666 [Smittium culicis]